MGRGFVTCGKLTSRAELRASCREQLRLPRSALQLIDCREICVDQQMVVIATVSLKASQRVQQKKARPM